MAGPSLFTPEEQEALKKFQGAKSPTVPSGDDTPALREPFGSEEEALRAYQDAGGRLPIPIDAPKGPPVDNGLLPFLKSTASAAIPELFGMEPVDDIKRYRDENPWGGAGSQIIGYTAPMLLGMGAARALGVPKMLGQIPGIGRGMATAERIQTAHPIGAAVIRDTYALLPYEGARLAGSAVAEAKGHEGAGLRTLQEVGLDLGLGLAFGGGLELLRQARPFASRAKYRTGGTQGRQIGTILENVPDYVPEEIPQVRHKILSEAKVPEAMTGNRREQFIYDIEAEQFRAQDEVLHQVPGTRERKDWRTPITTTSDVQPIIKENLSHIGVLEGGKRDRNWKKLSDLFVPKSVKGLFRTRKLTEGPGGFKTAEEAAEARKWLDAHPNWQERIQYPRVVEVSPKSLDGESVLTDTLRYSMGSAIEPGLFIRKEAGGLFVVAKKIDSVPSATKTVAKKAVEVGEPRIAVIDNNGKLYIGKKGETHGDLAERFKLDDADGAKYALGGGFVDKRGKWISGSSSELYGNMRDWTPDDLEGLGKSLAKFMDLDEVARLTGVPTPTGEAARWLLFKTHEPGHFFPKLQQATDVADKLAYRIKSATVKDADRLASKTYQHLDDSLKKYPPPGPGIAPPPKRQPMLRKMFEGLLPKEVEALRRDLGDSIGAMGRVAKEYMAPLSHKFSGSARFTWLNDTAKSMYEAASFRAISRYYGTRLPSKAHNLMKAVFERPHFEGGARDIIRKVHDLGPDQWYEFNVARVLTMSPEFAAEKGFHPGVVDALRKLDPIDRAGYEEIQRIHRYLGKGDETFTPLMYHRMMSMQWRGSFRARVVDKNGQTLGFGSGLLPGQAEKEAKVIIKTMDDQLIKEGKAPSEARIVEMFNSSYERDSKIVGELGGKENALYDRFRNAQVRAYMPQRFKERGGYKGFAGDIQSGLEPLTLKEAENSILGNMIETELHATHQVAMRELSPYIKDFSTIDGDALGAQMRKTLEMMQGVRGKFSQAVSEGVDRFLAPYIGANAAERIVRTVNRVQYGLTLGFMDIGYPLVNMTSILTQMVPEAAFVMRALPDDVARAYNFHLIPTADGGLVDVGVLSPVRLLWDAMKDLRNPSDELRGMFHRALSDNSIAPRFLEEVAGRDSELALRLGAALKGKESLVDVLKALNEFPGAKSEEMARAVAFAGGWRLFRNIIGLEQEAAYKATKHFVTRSMYGYSASERPLMLTGPLGTAFGLFKNYSFNYISNMMQFASEGAVRGNWAPLMWMMGTTGAVAGVGGTPLWLAAKGLNSVFSDSSLNENIYQLVGAGDANRSEAAVALADTFIHGFPTLAGISLQGRAQSPGSDPIRDTTMMLTVMAFERMKHVSTGVQQGIAHWKATGEHPINSIEMRDAFTLAFAPRTLQRYDMLTEDNAIRSLKTQNKLIDAQGPLMAALHVMGIQPLEMQKAYELDDIQRGYIDRKAENVRAFGSAYAQAKAYHNPQAMMDIVRRGALMGVPPESIIRSAHTQLNAMGHTREERTSKSLDALARARLFK